MQAGILIVAGNVSILKRSEPQGCVDRPRAALLIVGRRSRMIRFSLEAVAGEWIAEPLLRKGRMRAGRPAVRRQQRP
ncbi:hypothetical protein [Burkholderia diffusa]|uniref:hypothetical protein n=1 Tax=Burkholderia diffusa TaxID=488732 RepID=UPI00075415F4|nr:hypothetical protein [Burkholderia diffusa]